MQDFQQRVIDERAALDEKRVKLDEFMAGEMFSKLPQEERMRMARQLDAMNAYSAVLGERIAAFT